jgi:hypothetical protein
LLNAEELGSEAKRQTTLIQSQAAANSVPPPPPPVKQLTALYGKPAPKTAATGAAAATGAGTKAVAAPAPASASTSAASRSAPATAATSAPAATGAGSSSAAEAEAPQSTNPHERKPPYFCKKHERIKATRHCDHCFDDYCDTCAKMVEDNPLCPGCGGPLKKLMPDEQGFPPVPMGKRISEALAFPFKGSGKLMIGLGAIFMWVLHFGGSFGRNFSLIYMLAYVMKLCRTSASGREAPPEWPGLHELGGAWYFFVTRIVSIVPAILYLALFTRVNIVQFYAHDDSTESQSYESRQYEEEEGPPGSSAFDNQDISKPDREALQKRWEERQRKMEEERQAAELRTKMKLVPYYIIAVLGELYVPMALLALILYRSYEVLHPVFIFKSILKVKKDYAIVYTTLVVSEFFRVGPVVFDAALTEISPILALFAAPLIGAVFWLYLTMVYMRVLGALYYFNQKKIGWFERQPDAEAAVAAA